MTEKRFRAECVSYITPYFIVDNSTAKRKGKNTSYKVYETGKKEKTDELVNLLNSFVKENEQLKFENETLKSNYQREIQSSIDFCNAYSKTNGELLEEIEKLEKQNEQLRQILKDIVEVTDETYTKNTSMFKVTVVLDYEKYREIRRCIE